MAEEPWHRSGSLAAGAQQRRRIIGNSDISSLRLPYGEHAFVFSAAYLCLSAIKGGWLDHWRTGLFLVLMVCRYQHLSSLGEAATEPTKSAFAGRRRTLSAVRRGWVARTHGAVAFAPRGFSDALRLSSNVEYSSSARSARRLSLPLRTIHAHRAAHLYLRHAVRVYLPPARRLRTIWLFLRVALTRVCRIACALAHCACSILSLNS